MYSAFPERMNPFPTDPREGVLSTTGRENKSPTEKGLTEAVKPFCSLWKNQIYFSTSSMVKDVALRKDSKSSYSSKNTVVPLEQMEA